MKINKTSFAILLILTLSIILPSCQPSWQIELSDKSGAQSLLSSDEVNFYIEKTQDDVTSVPLGQLFYHFGYIFINDIQLNTNNNKTHTFLWDDVAENATISSAGEVFINNNTFIPNEIELKTISLPSEDYYSIMDIAPTIAYAMELPEFPESQGQVRITDAGTWEHAVMILLDGLQYDVLSSLIDAGKLPFFENLKMIRQGVTVYPPITTAASAALLTGTPPKINGVYGYGYRTTESTTLFDLAVQKGKSVTAVEGHSLSFNLRNAETILSGDRDKNGLTNDNVFENSIDVIESEMPDLLYIHFHDIDDMGHKYGPLSSEYETSIIQVDSYLLDIFNILPENTLIAIFADHGMHTTQDGGNHGTLTSADLIVPIILMEK